MRKLLVSFLVIAFMATPLFAQQTTQQTAPAKKKKSQPSKVYYGGTIGLSFGSYFRINIAPLMGYKVNPKASIGVKVAYEYIKDKRYDPALTGHNYGGSVFGRYRFIPNAYAHAEFAYMSYQYQTGNYETDRDWVPFLLLGGGYIQPLSPNASIIAEVLFDVLNDPNSPYESGSPFISIGVGVGF